MRVLHVIPTIGPRYGGASVACLELCRALVARGVESEIYTTDIDRPQWAGDASIRQFRVDQVSVTFFPTFGPDYYWISPQMFCAMRKHISGFDVVHIHSLYRAHVPVAVHYCRKHGVPYVLKPHGSLDPFLFVRRRFRKLPHELLFERPAFAYAAAIQFTSQEEMTLAAQTSIFSRGKNYRGVVVPSGVVIPEGLLAPTEAVTSLAQRFPELTGKRIILFLGRINFKKGLDILVRAYAAVARRYPDAHLVIAGPDNENYGRKVRKWLRDEGVLERTTFTGMLLGPDKTAALTASSVFVLPSYTENFGIAVIEAMCLGTPVVISDKVNICGEIKAAEAGLVVSCDAGETAAAIMQILDQPTEAQEMAKRGSELVRSRYSWEMVSRQMVELYQRLATKCSG